MNWLGILLLIIHVGACSALILIVLLQAGKGASLGAAFGGGASQTVFGARSATFIGRLTWVLFGVFLVTSLLLTVIPPWGAQTGAPRSDILQEEAVPPPSEKGVPQQNAPDNTYSGDVTQPQTAPAGGAAEQPVAPEQPGKNSQTTAPASNQKSAAKPAGSAQSSTTAQPAKATKTHK
jgi:preprotein translocase subunit SecG